MYIIFVHDNETLTEVQKMDTCGTKEFEMRQCCLLVVSKMENLGFNTELHEDKSAQCAQRKKDKQQFQGWKLLDPRTVVFPPQPEVLDIPESIPDIVTPTEDIVFPMDNPVEHSQSQPVIF